MGPGEMLEAGGGVGGQEGGGGQGQERTLGEGGLPSLVAEVAEHEGKALRGFGG